MSRDVGLCGNRFLRVLPRNWGGLAMRQQWKIREGHTELCDRSRLLQRP